MSGDFQAARAARSPAIDDDRRLRPGVPYKLQHLFEIMLHAAQCRLLELALAVPEVIGRIVAKHAEPMLGQVVAEGHIVRGRLPIPRGNDDRGTVGIDQLTEMVVRDCDRLTTSVAAFARQADHRRRR